MEEEIKEPNIIGSPRPTEELNPTLETITISESDTENIYVPDMTDYSTLFNSYKDIIEAHDNNINYLKKRIDNLNWKFAITISIAVVALFFAIIK